MRIVNVEDFKEKNKCTTVLDLYNLYYDPSGLKEKNNGEFTRPTKKYEIVKANIFDGKILLLDVNSTYFQNNCDRELYYDFDIANNIYKEKIELEQLQFEKENGYDDCEDDICNLYSKINRLKENDERSFQRAEYDYKVIINSNVYKEFGKLKEENEKIKIEKNKIEHLNEELNEKIKVMENNNEIAVSQNKSLWKKILSLLKKCIGVKK